MKRIRKAVVPVAGFGTRFLPASKATPKEMLPIVDKPVVQYVVEELSEAGIEQIIFITSWHKRAIEDHFDKHFELESKLEKAGKMEQLEQIQKITSLAEFVYVRQKEARGTGDAILTAEKIVGDEPFVVLWGDDFIAATPSRTRQLIEAYNKYQTTILGSIRTSDPEDTLRYGYAQGKVLEDGAVKVEELIEKPGPGKAPSDLAIVSGMVFPPEIFSALRKFDKTKEEGRELYYLDGVNQLREEGMDAIAMEIKDCKYYDCGNVTEYLKTNVEMALARDDLKEEFGEFIKMTAKNLK